MLEGSDKTILAYDWTFAECARMYSMQRLFQLSATRITRGIQMIKLTTLTLLFCSDISVIPLLYYATVLSYGGLYVR